MTTTPQTKPYDDLGVYGSIGELLVRSHLVGDGVAMFSGRGAPSGVVPGVEGQIYLDLDTGIAWQNTNDATAWTEWAGAGGSGSLFAAQFFALITGELELAMPSTATRYLVVTLDASGNTTEGTVYLPQTPADGSTVVVDVQAPSPTVAILVGTEGDDVITGGPISFPVNAAASVTLAYNAAQFTWNVIASVGIGGGGGGPMYDTFLSKTLAAGNFSVYNDINWGALGQSTFVTIDFGGTSGNELTGFVGGSPGKVLTLWVTNKGGSTIAFQNADGRSGASNQLRNPNAAGKNIGGDCMVTYIYIGTAWVMLSLTQ